MKEIHQACRYGLADHSRRIPHVLDVDCDRTNHCGEGDGRLAVRESGVRCKCTGVAGPNPAIV